MGNSFAVCVCTHVYLSNICPSDILVYQIELICPLREVFFRAKEQREGGERKRKNNSKVECQCELTLNISLPID